MFNCLFMNYYTVDCHIQVLLQAFTCMLIERADEIQSCSDAPMKSLAPDKRIQLVCKAINFCFSTIVFRFHYYISLILIYINFFILLTQLLSKIFSRNRIQCKRNKLDDRKRIKLQILMALISYYYQEPYYATLSTYNFFIYLLIQKFFFSQYSVII